MQLSVQRTSLGVDLPDVVVQNSPYSRDDLPSDDMRYPPHTKPTYRQRLSPDADALLERVNRLTLLNAHTIRCIEHERKALASELHDEMGASLALISLAIADLECHLPDDDKSAAITDDLTRIRELIEGMYRYKHRVIEGLRPPQLDHLGLEEAIRSYARQFSSYSGLHVVVSVAKSLPVIEENAALAIFRAIQELLTNVARHARATCVRINVRLLRHRFELSISDDGVGLTGSEPCHGGFGLLGIQERMETLGGNLHLASRTPKPGTTVTITVPLSVAACSLIPGITTVGSSHYK